MYTVNILGWTVTSRTIFGGASLYTFLQRLKVEQHVPLYDFLPLVHPASPLHLRHTLGGESSPVFGLQVLMS